MYKISQFIKISHLILTILLILSIKHIYFAFILHLFIIRKHFIIQIHRNAKFQMNFLNLRNIIKRNKETEN